MTHIHDMNTIRFTLLQTVLVFSLSLQALPLDPATPILVDASPFPSPAIAANAEQAVDWNGADLRRQNACTLSHAAVELHQFLNRLAGTGEEGFPVRQMADALPPRAIVLATLADGQTHPDLAAVIQAENLSGLLSTPESYALVPTQAGLFIIGADRAGVLYGVYRYLERNGVRWYGPEPHETVIAPGSGPILPAAPVIEAPAFSTRGFWVRQDWSNEPFYHWMARNRMNFWSIAEPNRALLHKLGIQMTYGGHFHFHEFMSPQDPYAYDHPLFDGDEDKPADPYPANPDVFQGDADGDGILSYFEARPEWYGLVDGERTPFEGIYHTPNICTSNPHAMDHLYTGMVNELTEGDWQDVRSLNFWSIDGGIWCQCESCEPLGTPTDRLLLMVHGLDQAIKEARKEGELSRSIRIIFPIYLETLPAPARSLPEGFDYETCVGTFFPIHRCYVHSINDPACTEYNTEHWEAFLSWTQAEPRFYEGEIFVGEYFNVSVNKSLPVLYSRIIHEDVPKYYAGGARHMHYMHTDTRLMGVKRLNNYLFANILWDTKADLDTLKAGYIEGLYGPVAGEMRQLYELLEFGLSNIKQMRYWHHLPERLMEDKDPLFDKDHFQLEESHPPINDGVDLSQSVQAMRECRKIMDRVMARELPTLIQSRLLIDDKTLRYGENTVYFYDAVARAVLAERAGDMESARREFVRSVPFARALRGEQEVVKTATNHHVHADDGLAATRIKEWYLAMGERLFPGFVL